MVSDTNKPEGNCHVETFLKLVHVDFSDFKHTHDEKEIKIFRVDL